MGSIQRQYLRLPHWWKNTPFLSFLFKFYRIYTIMDDRDARRAKVREEMEEKASKSRKKGFMTPERKKKLRLLLRKKAAEELKKEQERKAAERRKVIDERCGQPKDLDNSSEDDLVAICKEYHSKLYKIEGDKWDIERGIKIRVLEINELNIAVNDL